MTRSHFERDDIYTYFLSIRPRVYLNDSLLLMTQIELRLARHHSNRFACSRTFDLTSSLNAEFFFYTAQRPLVSSGDFSCGLTSARR